MQYRIYDRQTLDYKDGGYVRSYTIDDDYIVNNNSTFSVVKKKPTTETQRFDIYESGTYEIYKEYRIVRIELVSGLGYVVDFVGNKYTVIAGGGKCVFAVTYEIKNTLSLANVGDVVALIKDSGAYHKGVITEIDGTALTVSYKSDKELFNDTVLNAFITSFIDDDVKAAGRFGIDVVVEVLKFFFANKELDKYKALPIKFITSGDVLDDSGRPSMIWSWSNDSIKVVDWLVELFTKYNLSMSWTIDFDTALPLKQYGDDEQNRGVKFRAPKYVCTLSAVTNSGGIIKDNVAMQTITYTAQELPDATVCIVIDSESKEVINVSDGKNLLDPKAGEQNYYVYYRPGDANLSGAFISYQDRDDSNLSGYIRMRSTYNTPETGFTYSQASGDMKERAIIAYDADKKKIGYINYTPKTAGKFSLSFNITTFTMLGSNVGHPENIKYFRICYCTTGAEQQLEKGDEATEYDDFDIPSVYYLYEKDGEYSISEESDLPDKQRVLPPRTVIATYNENYTDAEGVTPKNVAQEKLMPSKFNQAVQIKINADSKMFDFQNARFGDLYKIINEQGTIDSNYTGRKETSENKWNVLYFGLGRQNYTDLIQIRMRKDRYNEVYKAG